MRIKTKLFRHMYVRRHMKLIESILPEIQIRWKMQNICDCERTKKCPPSQKV